MLKISWVCPKALESEVCFCWLKLLASEAFIIGLMDKQKQIHSEYLMRGTHVCII